MIEISNTKFHIRSERDEFVIKEQYIENVYGISEDLVKGKIIVDLGANVGAFSIRCHQFKAAKIFAYEPEPHNFEILLKNLKENNADSVVTYELAITPENKEYTMVDEFSGSGIKDWYLGTSTDENQVLGITLEKAIEYLDHVDLLKVDIEKSEYPVFTEANNETLKKIDMIVMEYHEIDAQNFGAMVQRLAKLFDIEIKGSIGNWGILRAYRNKL
jgi:FkbM family methyltransferase